MKHEGLGLFSRTTNIKTWPVLCITKLPEDRKGTVPEDFAKLSECIFTKHCFVMTSRKENYITMVTMKWIYVSFSVTPLVKELLSLYHQLDIILTVSLFVGGWIVFI